MPTNIRSADRFFHLLGQKPSGGAHLVTRKLPENEAGDLKGTAFSNLRAVLGPLVELVEIAIVREQRVFGFLVELLITGALVQRHRRPSSSAFLSAIRRARYLAALP
jgi:hypothetical protein